MELNKDVLQNIVFGVFHITPEEMVKAASGRAPVFRVARRPYMTHTNNVGQPARPQRSEGLLGET